MDEVPPTVFHPNDSEGEYAVVIDTTFEAVTLRNMLLRAAEDARKKADGVTSATIKERHEERFAIFTKYADRFERIRVMEAERITAALGLRSSQR